MISSRTQRLKDVRITTSIHYFASKMSQKCLYNLLFPTLNSQQTHIQYNQFQKQATMSNQHPFNPYMLPMPYYYPPPPFMNPMMPPNVSKPSTAAFGESPGAKKGYPMPPFGFPHFPMMYPPPPPHFFPFYDPKVPPKPMEMLPHPIKEKESFYSIQQSKKIKVPEPSATEKRQAPLIVLSDDDSKQQQKQKVQNGKKPVLEIQPQEEKVGQDQTKPRRTGRKIVPIVRQDPPAVKLRVKQKKKELDPPQKKIQKPEERQIKIVAETTIQNQNQTFGRSTRAKFLTAKDGKGKIMIGDEFQADLPIFLPRNEVLTVWMDERKNGLLCRFVKSKQLNYQ